MALVTQLTKNRRELVGIGYSSILNADDVSPINTPGLQTLVIDEYGPRWFRYVKNVSGAAQPCGTVMRRVADVALGSFTSGSTTSVTKAASMTANAHVGKVLIIEIGSVAGAAPEGESGIIVSNTAATATIDAGLPFSAAASTGSARIWAPWHADIAGAAVVAQNVFGVIVNPNGLSSNNYGWVQYDGPCPIVLTNAAAAISAGVAVVTGASGLAVTVGANPADTIIGYALMAFGATNAGFGPMMLNLGARGGVTV